jgi:hypothetical protein
MLKAKKAMMAIGAALSVAGRNAPSVIDDAVGVAGLAAVAYGCWLYSHPAGFIVGGLLAAGASLLRARGRAS